MSKYDFNNGVSLAHVRNNVIGAMSDHFDRLDADVLEAERDISNLESRMSAVEAGGSGGSGTQGPAGADGEGVPTGGTAGQILAKIDSTDFNTEWVDAPTGGSGSGSSTFVGLTDTPDTLTANRLLVASADGSSVEHMAPSGRGGIMLGAYNVGYDMGPVNSDVSQTQVGLCAIITAATTGTVNYDVTLPEIIHSGIPTDPQCSPGRIVYICNNAVEGCTYTCTPHGTQKIIVADGATSDNLVIKGGQWVQLVAVSPSSGYKHWHVLAAGSTALV